MKTAAKKRGRPSSGSLEELYPELADQLVDQSLRGTSKGSSLSLEWRCPRFPDHVWRAKVYNRTNAKNPTGCPVCDGKIVLPGFNDVATTHPDVAKMILDADLRTERNASSNKPIEFWCGDPAHSPWTAPLSRLTMQGSRCPQCAGRVAVPGVDDLLTTHPLIAAQLVDQSLATVLKPGSNTKVEWKCEDPDHHPWVERVYDRTFKGRGCKDCARKAVQMLESGETEGFPILAPTKLGPQRTRLSLRDGFDDRIWLNEAEWEAYRRRNPVRYLTKHRKALIERDGPDCVVCGGKGVHAHPLQVSHRIPFLIGVINWGLTPDWLDRLDNLALAHKGDCNNRFEVIDSNVPAILEGLGIDVSESPVAKLGYWSR